VSEQDRIGTIIGGHYQLRVRLSQDGLSNVYLAHDLKLSRDVVIKGVRTRSDRERARLMRESRVLARLAAHTSGVARYVDFVQDQDEFYLITEHLRGKTLDAWQQRPRERDEILAVYARMARVLHDVHQAGVAHRDLKPSNVIVDPPRVVLIDFGLAVLAMETDELTGAGTFVGTPVYVSPEILQGQTATPASDIFALGVMLFEALTGERPWYSLRGTLSQAPALGELEGTELGDLIAAMLDARPEARPSAREVADALDEHTGARPRVAREAPEEPAPPPPPPIAQALPGAGQPIAQPAPPERLQPESTRMRALPPVPAGRPAAPAATRSGAPHIAAAAAGIGVAFCLYLLFHRSGLAMTALTSLLLAAAIVAAVMLVRVAIRRRESARSATQSRVIPEWVEERLRIIEARLEDMGQVSSSVAVQVGEIRPHLDYERLEQIVRQSVLLTVSELQVGAGASDVGKAIKALADVAQRGEGPWYTRVSTWLTAGGLFVGFAGGAMGLMSSAGIWRPNTVPTIQSFTTDKKRATITAPVELRVDASDTEGAPLSYTYQTTAGRISSNGPLALLYLDTSVDDELVRVDVTVSDGKERVSRSTSLPINRRPALALQAPATAAPGAAVAVTADGPPDPDGDALTYRWSASAGQLGPDTGRQATITAPASAGAVHVRCTVSDGWETWDLDGTTIVIQ
jgi:predicted Ser/Thr protein kinase